MALYATLGSTRIRATHAGPHEASCSDCHAPMVAKLGDVMIHHWAHQSRPLDCRVAEESEWHREWKALGIDGSQEVANETGTRRTDVQAPGGFAVEFQMSALTAAEVRSREIDWDDKLVWVFDAKDAFDTERLRMLGDGPRYGFHWYRAPERIHGATCPTFYDIGNGRLLFIHSSREKGTTSLSGQCAITTRDDVVRCVLRGNSLPAAPTRHIGDYIQKQELQGDALPGGCYLGRCTPGPRPQHGMCSYMCV